MHQGAHHGTCKASGNPGAKPHELVDALKREAQRFCCFVAGRRAWSRS